MKTFIYIIKKTSNVRYPRIVVYRVQNNMPDFLFEFKLDRASNKGGQTEVFELLAGKGYLPKRWINRDKGYKGYFTSTLRGRYQVRIEEVGI